MGVVTVDIPGGVAFLQKCCWLFLHGHVTNSCVFSNIETEQVQLLETKGLSYLRCPTPLAPSPSWSSTHPAPVFTPQHLARPRALWVSDQSGCVQDVPASVRSARVF